MSDILNYVTTGQPFSESAKFRNAVVDVLRDYDRKKRSFEAIDRPVMPLPRPRPLTILNVSGGNLKQYGIVGIGNPVNLPTDNLDEFLSRVAHDSAAPTVTGAFAIVLESAPDDVPVPALTSGLVQCRISVGDVTHEYAGPAAGNYVSLASQSATGPATIRYRNVPINTQLNGAIDDSQTTIVVDAATGWPDTSDLGSYVILVESEKMLVTGDAGASRTVTRGYSGTSAAAHADNTAVAFLTGTVWGEVAFAGTFVEGSILTNSGVATGPDYIFSVGTGGSDFNTAASGSTVTFHLPNAGVSKRGVITNGDQTIQGMKTTDDSDGSHTSGWKVTSSFLEPNTYAEMTAAGFSTVFTGLGSGSLTYGTCHVADGLGNYAQINADPSLVVHDEDLGDVELNTLRLEWTMSGGPDWTGGVEGWFSTAGLRLYSSYEALQSTHGAYVNNANLTLLSAGWDTSIDEWDSGESYVVSDSVLFNGVRYTCAQNHTNQNPNANPSYWTVHSYRPHFLVKIGGTTLTGAWGPDGVGNEVSGGIITALGDTVDGGTV